MSKLYNLARMTTATAGTGTITLGAAVSGYLTFALAGVANLDVVSYGIKDGANSEVGTGTYTSAGTTLTRSVTKSTNSNAAISLSGAAEVFITPRAEDLIFINPPQGRLTLQTVTPVMTTTQSAKTTIFYTPYTGNQVPIYDGTSFRNVAFSELSVLTTDTTKSAAAIGASKVNDWFVWDDAGTTRIGHGPDWTSDTARSAGTALVMVNGINLNNAAITNGPAASRGTYVGTTRSNGSSQLDWIYGAIAAGGTAGFFGVWNAYNRVDVSSMTGDSGASWTYALTTIRAANASTTIRHSYVMGLAEDKIDALYNAVGNGTAGSVGAVAGIGHDATNAYVGSVADTSNSATATLTARYTTTDLGFHFVSACESASAAITVTFIGTASFGAQSGLFFSTRM